MKMRLYKKATKYSGDSLNTRSKAHKELHHYNVMGNWATTAKRNPQVTNSNQSSQNTPHYPWSSSANKPWIMPHPRWPTCVYNTKVIPGIFADGHHAVSCQMDPFKIIEEGVRKLLSGLNPTKAAGPNKLQPWELAYVLAPVVTPHLQCLKQRCLETVRLQM